MKEYKCMGCLTSFESEYKEDCPSCGDDSDVIEVSAHTDKLSVEKLQEIRVEELKDFNSKILQAELKNQKLQERCDRYEKALEDIRTNTPIQELLNLPYGCACHEIASEALAAIGGDDE